MSRFQTLEGELERNRSSDLISEVLKRVNRFNPSCVLVDCSKCLTWHETVMQPALRFCSFVPQTCLHPLCRQFPPSVRFRKMFLTELIRRVGARWNPRTSRPSSWLLLWTDVSPLGVVSLQQEAAGCEPLDELYDALGEVVGAEDTTECYKSYLLVPEQTLIILTEQKDILDPDSDVLVLVLLCCSPVVKLSACWRTWLWSQEAPPAWWPGRRLSTWQSGLWITTRPSAAGTENLTWQSSWITEDSSQNSLRSISKSSHLHLFQPVRAWSDQLVSFDFSSATFPQ